MLIAASLRRFQMNTKSDFLHLKYWELVLLCLFWLLQELKVSQCLSVSLSGTSLLDA